MSCSSSSLPIIPQRLILRLLFLILLTLIFFKDYKISHTSPDASELKTQIFQLLPVYLPFKCPIMSKLNSSNTTCRLSPTTLSMYVTA